MLSYLNDVVKGRGSTLVRGWYCQYVYCTMSSKETQPRQRHAAFGVGDKHFLWGGLGDSIPTTQMETFNVFSTKWVEPQLLKGSFPDRLNSMAVTTDGVKAYTFGGQRGSTRINNIYEINPLTLQCTKISPASFYSPPSVAGSGMVFFNQNLVVYGGLADDGSTNHLHAFDLRTGEYGNCKLCMLRIALAVLTARLSRRGSTGLTYRSEQTNAQLLVVVTAAGRDYLPLPSVPINHPTYRDHDQVSVCSGSTLVLPSCMFTYAVLCLRTSSQALSLLLLSTDLVRRQCHS